MGQDRCGRAARVANSPERWMSVGVDCLAIALQSLFRGDEASLLEGLGTTPSYTQERDITMKVFVVLIGVLLAVSVSVADGASLEKAKTLRANGLLLDAKRELVELTYSADASSSDKASALLLLGDIAIDENKGEVARENWTKVPALFPDLPEARIAQEKLVLLDKLAANVVRPSAATATDNIYPPGTVLVVGPKEFPWSIAQISGALGPTARPFDGTLPEAMTRATSDPSIAALVEIALTVDVAFESGRVVCQLPTGKKVWEEKVMFNLGGGQERIARRFVDGLSEKIKKRKCPA